MSPGVFGGIDYEKVREVLREELDETWQSGGAGREAVAEELRGELGREAYSYGYFKEAGEDWNGKSIDANAATDELPTIGYRDKTFYFLSDTDGTLSIEVKEPDGEWRTYDTVSIVANSLAVYPMTAQSISVRLSFSVAATVTAWYVMKV